VRCTEISQQSDVMGHEDTHAPQQDKTFIGRIERSFANFIEKASRLYEQKRSAILAATALEMYVRR
jgi:hypothetical protein